MLHKSILICCLFLTFSVGAANENSNLFYKTANVVDSTLFSIGLLSLVVCVRTGDYARTDLINSMMHIRILIEVYRIMHSSIFKKAKIHQEKNETQELIKIVDGMLTSSIFLKYGQLILSEIDNLKDKENLIPLAFGLRCLVHLRTTTAPLLKYL